jgi:hypothetical protein
LIRGIRHRAAVVLIECWSCPSPAEIQIEDQRAVRKILVYVARATKVGRRWTPSFRVRVGSIDTGRSRVAREVLDLDRKRSPFDSVNPSPVGVETVANAVRLRWGNIASFISLGTLSSRTELRGRSSVRCPPGESYQLMDCSKNSRCYSHHSRWLEGFLKKDDQIPINKR